MGLLDFVRPAAAALTGSRRRVWAGSERAHLELRHLEPGEVDGFAVALEESLLRFDAVQWVEVYQQLARIVVAFDRQRLPVAELVAAVEAVEADLGLEDRPFPSPLLSHPADVEPLVREAAKLGADVIGLAIGVSWRIVLPAPGPVRAVAGSFSAVVNGVPRVRNFLCSRFDWPVTDVALTATTAVAQGLAAGPLGPLADLFHHLSNLGEKAARHRAWLALEADLFAKPGAPPPAVLVAPRPGPLPDGPVERFMDRAWPMSISVAGVVLFTLRDPRRAAGVMEAAVPKPARYGREAFAAQLGRDLAGRGVLVLKPEALRVLDRVDCLVVEGRLLSTGDVVAGEVVVLGEHDPGETGRRVRSLFDPEATGVVRRGAWRLGPLGRLRVDLPQRTRARVAEVAAGDGSVLGLARGRELAAVVRTRPVLRPEGQDLLVLARRAGLEVVVATDAAEMPPEADRCISGGAGLTDAVRALQGDGRVVCVVGSSPGGLAAADCAIGLRSPGEPPPADADLICSDGLRQACFVVEATAEARAVSSFSARTALVASGAAGVVALQPFPGVLLRAGTVVNTAAMLTMAEGTRRAVALARRPRPLPRDPTPWHAMEPEAVLSRLGSSPEGLTPGEARRRAPERARSLPAPLRLGRDVAEEVANPLTPVLGVGAALSLAAGAPVDAVLVGAVVGLNAVIGGAQRYRAEAAFSALEEKGKRTTTIRRGGEEVSLDAELLVPGDVVHLRAGDAVTADCRILEADWLEVDESSLTGESFPVAKGCAPVITSAVAERSSMLYDGTFVAAGEAVAAVVATGRATEARRALVVAQGPPDTGVESRLRRLTDLTLPVALGGSALTAGMGLLRRQPVAGLAAGAVSLAVAAVPEGLPLLSGVAQLSAARRLARRGVLVRNSRAVEALGRVDVMCVDKTGTVTKGKLALALVAHPGGEEDLEALSPRARLVLGAALRATPERTPDRPLPHPTDRAVVKGGERAEVAAEEGAGGWQRLDELPFEPARGYHATLGRHHGGLSLAVKGAPEIVLPRCTAWLDMDGQERSLGPETRRLLDAQLRRITRRGLRVLAVVHRSASHRRDLDEDRVNGLTFLGFVALSDPVRPTAVEAVRNLHDAGVTMVMITGDHPSTAEGIATELGLLNGAPTVTGTELDELDDAELVERVRTARVFARVTPAHKVRIVQAFQQGGRVVAMTGDGANDAPAIRLADVGIAVGKRATAAAREAADLVAPKNRLEVLVAAVAEGRGMWVSVRDAVALLVGGNLGEIGFTVGGTLLGGAAPLGPRQLLLVNLLTDVAPAMAIAVQPPASRSFADLLREGPEASLGSALNRAIALRAACTAAAASGAWLVGRVTGPPARARTVGLAALVGAQLGQTLVVTRPSRATLAASLGSAALLVAVIQTPGLSQVFGCTPLDPLGWCTAAVAAAAGTGASVALPRLAAARRREEPEAELPPSPAPAVVTLPVGAPPRAPAARSGGRPQEAWAARR